MERSEPWMGLEFEKPPDVLVEWALCDLRSGVASRLPCEQKLAMYWLGSWVVSRCPCKQEWALRGLGSRGVSRCPCELDWALCELRSRAISRCACGHEWTLSGRKGWVVSRCPFSRLCGRRDCVGYNIGWKTSMWTDWPAHFPGMKQKIKERKINTN